MRGLDVVLFDLGGVLTSDPWQSILLTPGRGIADRCALNRTEVEAAADRLWPRYSLERHSEAEYWEDLGALLGVRIPPDAVREAKQDTVIRNEQVHPALAVLGSHGVAWGVISDNTAFWYDMQVAILGIRESLDPRLEFLSFEYGLSKNATTPTLFEAAAKGLGGSSALVIDDRPENLVSARSAGFEARSYSLPDDPRGSGLVALLERVVR